MKTKKASPKEIWKAQNNSAQLQHYYQTELCGEDKKRTISPEDEKEIAIHHMLLRWNRTGKLGEAITKLYVEPTWKAALHHYLAYGENQPGETTWFKQLEKNNQEEIADHILKTLLYGEQSPTNKPWPITGSRLAKCAPLLKYTSPNNKKRLTALFEIKLRKWERLLCRRCSNKARQHLHHIQQHYPFTPTPTLTAQLL